MVCYEFVGIHPFECEMIFAARVGWIFYTVVDVDVTIHIGYVPLDAPMGFCDYGILARDGLGVHEVGCVWHGIKGVGATASCNAQG